MWIGKYKNIKHYFESWWEVVKNGYPAGKLVVIGVTGTDGKTTTCHLIYEILRAVGKKVAMVSTVAAYIGGEEIDTGFHVTTPDAKFLQPFIKRVADAGMEYLVLEVTSHGLDQHRVVGCNFKIGVVTNITHEHLDYHKSFEKYRETKAKLILNAQYAILNRDDSSFEYLGKKARGKVIAYGKANVKNVSPVLVGEYNQYNIGAAAAVAGILEIRNEITEEVVKEFGGVLGRREEIKLGQKFRAIVDFAHTPNALEQVLKSLKTQKRKNSRIILVFGCASERDVAKRPVMGKVAKKLADEVIVTAEDPRREDLGKIFTEITGGESGFVREDDRQKAIEMAVGMARSGDIVMATGKGHEKSMNIDGVEYPWSDLEAMKKAIKKVL